MSAQKPSANMNEYKIYNMSDSQYKDLQVYLALCFVVFDKYL